MANKSSDGLGSGGNSSTDSTTSVAPAEVLPDVDPYAVMRQGHAALRSLKFDEAIAHYTTAINATADSNLMGILFSERSSAFAAQRKFVEALADAELAVTALPTWHKSHFRRAMALEGLDRNEEAIKEYKLTLKGKPDFQLARDAIKRLKPDEETSPILLQAIRDDDVVIVKYLLSAGCDPNATGPCERTMIYYAKSKQIAIPLIEFGACLDVKDDDGRTPLHFAILQGYPTTALLVKSGADIEAKNDDGWTPMHVGAHFDRKADVDLLVSRGASVCVANEMLDTPLHYAKSAKIVTTLLAAGADVEAQNQEGQTPLQLSVLREGIDVVTALIAAGADTDVKGTDGDENATIRDWAVRQRNTKLVSAIDTAIATRALVKPKSGGGH